MAGDQDAAPEQASARFGSVDVLEYSPYAGVDMDDQQDWLDTEEQQDWYAFAYVLTQVPAALEARMQRDTGISHFDYLVMSTLSMAPEGSLRMSEVAHYTGSTLSRLSNVVSKLEARDWVRRSPDPSSRRYTLATLTPGGRR